MLFNLFSTAVIIIAVVSMAYIWKAHLLPLRVDTMQEYSDMLLSDGASLKYSVTSGDATLYVYGLDGEDHYGMLTENNGKYVVTPKSEIHAKVVDRTSEYVLSTVTLSGSECRFFLVQPLNGQLADVHDSEFSTVCQIGNGSYLVEAIATEKSADDYVLYINGKEYSFR